MANALKFQSQLVAQEVFVLMDTVFLQLADLVQEELNVLLVQPVQEGSNAKTTNVLEIVTLSNAHQE